MKLKNGNFDAMSQKPSVLKHLNIDSILISRKIFSHKNNYKLFIDNIDDDYKLNHSL